MSANISGERRPLLYRNPSRSSRSSQLNSNSSRAPTTPTTFHNNSRRNLCKIRAASTAILLSLVFERIAFYGLVGNLVLFLNKEPYRWESYHAIDASLYFFGLSFVMSLIGGWLADAFLGRFKALLISFLIYVAGYVLMPLMTQKATKFPNGTMMPHKSLPSICNMGNDTDAHVDDSDHDPFDERCAWLIYIALTVIAIGTGFVKANIAPFGSDQVSSLSVPVLDLDFDVHYRVWYMYRNKTQSLVLLL